MATLLDPASARRAARRLPAGRRGLRVPRPPAPAPHTPIGRAVLVTVAAVRAAALSWLPLALLVILGWLTAAGGASTSEAGRTSAYVWLAAHGTTLRWHGGALGLWPLGLAVLPGLALAGSIARLVDLWGSATLRRAALPVAACAAAYASLVSGVAALSRTSDVQPLVLSAGLHAVGLAAVAGLVGAVRSLRRQQGYQQGDQRAALPVMPARPGLLLAGAVAALATLVATGALMTAASLGAHLPEAVAASCSLHTGLVGGLLLMLGQAALLPDAVLWAASWGVGPGFAVGTGTYVSPSGVVTGTLPDVPLLAALPSDAPAPGLTLLTCLLPLLAGAAAGAVVVRRGPARQRPDTAAATAAAAGGIGGLVLGLLASLTSGAAGTGHLQTVGPAPLAVAVAAAGQLALVAAGTAWVLAYRARRAAPLPR